MDGACWARWEGDRLRLGLPAGTGPLGLTRGLDDEASAPLGGIQTRLAVERLSWRRLPLLLLLAKGVSV